MKIKIFTTGGSIDKIYSTRLSNFIVGEPQVGGILEQANVAFDYEVESLMKKDSLELTESDRRLVFEKVSSATEHNIMITHGTDTMINTALLLLDVPDKVIVLTGAMQPAAFKYSDAPINIGSAAAALQILPDGVYIAMNGRIYDPRRARKNVLLNRFEETN